MAFIYNKINIRDVIAGNYWRRFYSTFIQPVASWYPSIGVIFQCYCREFADYHAEAEPIIVGGCRTGIPPKLAWCASKSTSDPLITRESTALSLDGRYSTFSMFYFIVFLRYFTFLLLESDTLVWLLLTFYFFLFYCVSVYICFDVLFIRFC